MIRPEFDRLSTHAAQVAYERATELTENFLERLYQNAPEHFSILSTPHMQRALQSAQLEFAMTGDEELGRVLVDLLVELSGTEIRTIYATSITESLRVAPNLTVAQMNALAIIERIRVRVFNFSGLDAFYHFLETEVVPFTDQLPGAIDLRHMQAMNVGWIGIASTDSMILEILNRYPGLFSLGFSSDELPPHFPEEPTLFIPAIRDSSKQQISLIASDHVDVVIQRGHPLYNQRDTIKQVQKLNLMPLADVEHEILKRVPGLAPLVHLWQDTNVDSFQLTSIGIAIGGAHVRSRVPTADVTSF